MILAAVNSHAARSTYHGQHHDEKDGSAREEGNTPDWHLVGRFFRGQHTRGTEACVSVHASPDDMSKYVVHHRRGGRRNMGWRICRVGLK